MNETDRNKDPNGSIMAAEWAKYFLVEIDQKINQSTFSIENEDTKGNLLERFFRRLFIVLFCSISCLGYGQSIDSMKIVLSQTTDQMDRAKLYTEIAAQYTKHDTEQATLYLDSARSISVYASLPEKALKITFVEGAIAERRQEFDKARELFSTIIDGRDNSSDTALVAQSYYKMGNLERRASNTDKAIGYLNTSKDIYETINDPIKAASSDVVLGIIYKNSKQYDQAIEYYSSALTQYESVNNYDAMATCILNIANVKGRQGLHNEALELYDDAYGLAQKLDRNQGLLAFIYGNQANSYQQLEQYDKAYEANQKAYAIRKDNAPPREKVNSLVGMANSLGRLSRYQEALELLSEAEKISESTDGMLTASMRIQESYSKIYEDLGQSNKALAALKNYNTIKDSIYQVELDKQVITLNEQLETEKKEKEIVKLNAQQAEDQARIKRVRDRNIVLTIGLASLCGLLWYIYSLLRKTKTQNEIINKALLEKQTLLQEIHHRVKNNLQFISSLLNLQSAHVQDNTALSALREGQDRVQSMALIHQNLYQEDNLTGVDMEEYFTKLIRGLFDSYNIRPDQISLQIDIEDLNLDVDSVIPIGLIVNELISNSLKHAFPDQRKGIISVSMAESDAQLILRVSDDGVGMDHASMDALKESFGYRLIHVFLDQLQAKLNIDSSSGTEVTLHIRQYELA